MAQKSDSIVLDNIDNRENKCEKKKGDNMAGKNVLVAQSGGPTAVINASLAGVIKAGLEDETIGVIYGALYGVQGLLEEKLINLNEYFEGKPEKLERLKHTPAMFLKSCRFRLSTKEQYEKIKEILLKNEIGYMFYIGGNDSMDTVQQLSEYFKETGTDIKVIGIPKTIDNDLAMIDHTPGFGSAAKFIATSIREMRYDLEVYDMESLLFVEIMGRNAGWLTAAAVLAGTHKKKCPDLIYLPEIAFDEQKMLKDIKEILKEKKQVIIAVSEGIKDESGICVSEDRSVLDSFGHGKLRGVGQHLASLAEKELGCKTRSVELNVLQRSAASRASATDVEEAELLGMQGVRLAREGKSGELAILKRTANRPYQVEYLGAAIEEIANVEKVIPSEWINKEENYVMEEMVEYLRPLIQGEVQIEQRDGMPEYLEYED